jgi:hypothetical protein
LLASRHAPRFDHGVRVVRVWKATAVLLGSLSFGLGCSDDHPIEPRDDGGGGGGAKSDGMVVSIDGGEDSGSGDSGTAGSVKPGGAGGVGGLWFDAGRPPATGSVCTLSVGARCDGPEDCPVPQSCCAQWDPARIRYTSIGCRLSCDRPDLFELCHVEQGGCKRSGYTCQRSVIIPHDFITICSNARLPAAAINDKPLVGKIVCGSDQCVAGVEECCLRSHYDFAERMSVALDPYCAPLGSDCSCSSLPPDGDNDGGMVSAMISGG